MTLPVPHLPSSLLTALASGGQSRARRNAWAGMSADAARARERRQAQAALLTAALRAQGRRDDLRA